MNPDQRKADLAAKAATKKANGKAGVAKATQGKSRAQDAATLSETIKLQY